MQTPPSGFAVLSWLVTMMGVMTLVLLTIEQWLLGMADTPVPGGVGIELAGSAALTLVGLGLHLMPWCWRRLWRTHRPARSQHPHWPAPAHLRRWGL